uniref:Translation initiation factor 2 subunit alpha n=1 Tax=uncultured marine thaumarchaeote KM3_73_B11 TaxID=1456265 RepID=A0A075HP61_9ARCH|nr:RNA-binding S1 domain-containing protein [uncultured marine thaumarchaeote KM3_73_B11]
MPPDTQELPEIGEIVIATIAKISDHGAYVTLDEYNKIQGFLHVSEIAPGWVRKVNKYVKEGEKKVLLVKKVETGRKEIDLSLKQISKEQRKKKLLDVKRFEKEQGILKNIEEKAKLTTKQIEELEDQFLSKYDSVYDAMLNIAIKGTTEINDLKLPKKILTTIEEICSKMKLPSVELRGILEISNNQSNGVELIRKTLSEAENTEEAKIEITYLGAPRYRLSLVSQDFKTAEKSLKPILEKIEKNVKKQNGMYNFTREESIKIGEG